MAKTLGVFDFGINVHGAHVVVVKEPLCPGCSSDGEIDHNIKLLKDDLDAVAARMKEAVRAQARGPVF